jgi:integrase
MAEPEFDRSTGWWFIRYRTSKGQRRKKTLKRDERWTKGGGWPAKGKRPKPPGEVLVLARPFQDIDTAVRLGVEVNIPRATDLETYCRSYAAEKAASHAANTSRMLRQTFVHWFAFCRAHRIRTVEGLTVAHCRAYVAERLKVAARGTVKTERGLLSPIWVRAAMDRLIPANPWALAPFPGRDRLEAPKFWRRDEAEKLVGTCKGYLRDVVIVGLNTGLRITALLRLTWDDVDFARGVVVCRAGASKSSRRYEVPLSEAARVTLERRAMTVKSPLVFPSPRTGKAMVAAVTWKAIGRAVRRAGIPDHGSYNHILRHTFASNAVLAGVPLAVVSKWLGHSSIATTNKYMHLSAADSAAQMEKFSLGGPSPTPGPPTDGTGGPGRSPGPAGGTAGG